MNLKLRVLSLFVLSQLLAVFAHAGDEWMARAQASLIPGRAVHTAVWTGEEMIVWGGEGFGVSFNTGARFSAKSNVWNTVSTVNAPENRSKHHAVWTGQEMIIWGGYNGAHLNSGGVYNPKTDTWRSMTTVGAPSGRIDACVVWTGTEMIVWGGAQVGPDVYGDGAIYNPVSNQWRPMSSDGAPSARGGCIQVWTGSEMIVWGGDTHGSLATDGAIYNPQSDTWRPLSSVNAPSGRTWILDDVWTGTEMIVWGGANMDLTVSYNDGARYNVATDTWTRMSNVGSPSPRNRMSTVWTGKEFVVFGGSVGSGPANVTNDGGRYNPQTDTWSPMTNLGAPQARMHATAIWTGASVLVFGGYTGGGHLNDCASYSPEDNFTNISANWLTTYFGVAYRHNPLALPDSDADADGNSNLREYLMNTNPLDPLEGFAASIALMPQVSWRSVPGKYYRILRTYSLESPQWQVVMPSLPSSGTNTSFMDYEGVANKGFYKIEVLQP